MKTTQTMLVPCLLIGLFATTTQAQDQYQTTMSTLITQIDTTKAKVENLKVANTFGRIADVEKTKWLPYYYAAYFTALESVKETDLTKVDMLCDQADKYLEQADLLSPKNSEVYCIRSMVTMSRIKVNQSARAMTNLPLAQQSLGAARTYDEQNPRVYFMMGQQLYNTPEAFGGSKEKALSCFEKALALLETQRDREQTIDVHWGKGPVNYMAALCRKKLQVAQKSE